MNIRIKPQLNINQVKDKAIWIVFIAIFIGFAVANDRFLTVSNMVTVARQVSMYGIAAVGMTFVILIAGIDLSKIGRAHV